MRFARGRPRRAMRQREPVPEANAMPQHLIECATPDAGRSRHGGRLSRRGTSHPGRRPPATGMLLLALFVALFFAPGFASAHPGGLNSDGCHTNRKTGEYHCHRAPAPALSAPSRLGAVRGTAEPASATPRPQGAFANCAAARAAGAAPVRRGDPGYGPHLDRDNDGVGCE